MVRNDCGPDKPGQKESVYQFTHRVYIFLLVHSRLHWRIVTNHYESVKITTLTVFERL